MQDDDQKRKVNRHAKKKANKGQSSAKNDDRKTVKQEAEEGLSLTRRVKEL